MSSKEEPEAKNLTGLLVRFKVRAENPRGDVREVGQLAFITGQWPAFIRVEPVPARRIDVAWGHGSSNPPYAGSIYQISIEDVEILGPPP